MKKAVITLVAMLTLLCGCQANENTNASDYGDDISKAQEIAVISPDTAEVIDTITDTKEIENFVSVLDLDQWELKTLPDEASEIGSFGFVVLLDWHRRKQSSLVKLILMEHYMILLLSPFTTALISVLKLAGLI